MGSYMAARATTTPNVMNNSTESSVSFNPESLSQQKHTEDAST